MIGPVRLAFRIVRNVPMSTLPTSTRLFHVDRAHQTTWSDRRPVRMTQPLVTLGALMKVRDVIRTLERDGWRQRTQRVAIASSDAPSRRAE